MTQHPQRCETCEHRDADRSQYPPAEYSCYCNLKRMWVHMYCNNWIGYVGCASHSSASGPAPEQMGDPWNCTDLGIECPDPEQDWCSWPCDKWLLCHDASIATKARAEVLDELRDWSYTIGCNNAAIAAIGLRDRIESLRQQRGGP